MNFPALQLLAQTELSDIREIVPQPPVWPWIAALVAILLLAAFLLWKKRRPTPADSAPPESPHAKALRLLAELRARAETLDDESFTVALSSILRRYLEEALQLPAPEQTTDEFLQHLRSGSPLAPDLQPNLENFLRQTDLVKFARQPLTPDQRENLLETARQTIDATRPKPEAETVSKTQPEPAAP